MNIRQLNEAIDEVLSTEKDKWDINKVRLFDKVVKENGHLLRRCNDMPADFYDKDGNKNYTVVNPFNYSQDNGGLALAFQYYNDYVVLIPKNKAKSESMYDFITDDFLKDTAEMINKTVSDTKKEIKLNKKYKEESVKSWYKKEYPTDELGDDINSNIDFATLYDRLGKEDFYAMIGNIDSIVRERIFDRLAELNNVSYDTIYNKWLAE